MRGNRLTTLLIREISHSILAYSTVLKLRIIICIILHTYFGKRGDSGFALLTYATRN